MARLTVTVWLLCLSSVGFCCNKGWHLFQGKCYTVIPHTYDFIHAKRYCQLSQATLAHVTSKEMLRSFGNMSNFDGMHGYWVAQGSSLPDSSTPPEYDTMEVTRPSHSSENCPYVKVLELKNEYCSVEKYFICETTLPKNCPRDFASHGDNCYRAVTYPKADFDEASVFCLIQNSRLAILDTEEKEYEAKAALIGKNETFIVSAQKNESGIEWTNGNIFNPVHDIFVNFSDGSCVAYLSLPEKPLEFSWKHVKCYNHSYSYLCESSPLPPPEVQSTTTPVTTTTQAPLECPHGYNWKSHEESGYCFWETTYETERLNWFQAREFCKLYGGDLASYNSEEQEVAGLGGARGHYRGLWLGLKRDENNVFHWIDGSVLNFTNWASDEPNLSSNTKFCVSHRSGTSQWELDYCGVRRWFICKAPKVRNPLMPEMPPDKKTRCDIKGVSSYRSQWYEYENHCYLIHEANKYSWDTARYFCQDNDAHMVSIHSFEETNFILSAITGYPEANFWIGLSTKDPESAFEWSDNSPLEFIYWSETRNDIKDFNTCVIFNKRDGSWDIDHCNRQQGVICKRGVNSSYDFTSTEPSTIMPGNCENGWYNLGNKCYKLIGSLWSERLTWPLAKKDCEDMGANLVSIHNKDEQEFLTDVVLEAHTNAWLGLRAVEKGSIFNWNDDTRMDYTNWNANEPKAYHTDIDLFYGHTSFDLCAEMEYDDVTIGKWNAIRCSEKKAYLCQKWKDPTIAGPYVDPFVCPNITGWSRLESSCYGFFEQYNMTWMDAQRECAKHSASLVTYKTVGVSIFVKRKLKLKKAHFWTGAREKRTNTYEYATGEALFYTNWMSGQPRAASTYLDNCVATTAEGSWLVKSCKDKLPFICQTHQESESEPELKIDRSHSCSNVSRDWNDFGGNYCYYIESDIKMRWVDSTYYCLRNGGHLASFHSMDEIERLRQNSHYKGRLHIGLMKNKDGAFQWVDKTPLDFVNWEDDPDQLANYECVYMDMQDGKWSLTECSERLLGFICSAPKLRVISEEYYFTTEEGTTAAVEHSDPGNKLLVGGIFGFVICVLVIAAIIGVLIYNLKRKNEVKPQLLEQDNL